MDERIHRVLDGEVPRQALTSAETLELLAVESSLDAALQGVPAEPPPDLTAAVLARIAGHETARASRRPPPAPAGAWQRFAEWLLRPRPLTIVFRPIHVLGALALAALVVPMLPAPAVGPGGAGADAEPARLVLVQFRLDAPDAREVALAGEFTNWQPAYALRRSAAGVWTVVAALEPGVHDYAFVVDGEQWVPDPMAPAVDDGFGGLNSRVAVMTPDGVRPL